LTQIQWWIWEEKLFEIKLQRLVMEMIVMEILPCLFLAHIFFMNNTFPHIRTNIFLTHSFSSFSLPPTQDIPFYLGKPPYLFLEFVPLV
jgi:hypothetical protein